MASIYACSTVSLSTVILDSEYLQGVYDFDNIEFEYCIYEDELYSMKEKLYNLIEVGINSITSEGKNTLSTFKQYAFKEELVTLDLRRSKDFVLASLLDLLEILIVSIERNGFLYLFNRDNLAKITRIEIVNQLKICGAMKIEELVGRINIMASEYSDVCVTNYQEVRSSVLALHSNGYVDIDADDKYKLTSKGYLLTVKY